MLSFAGGGTNFSYLLRGAGSMYFGYFILLREVPVRKAALPRVQTPPHSKACLLLETLISNINKAGCQAVNLRGFRASMNPRFDGEILEFMDGIPNFMENFNTF